MANRLASAISPYLQQHADNPVDWWEWGPDAFAEARSRDLPVLLSVGYAACHWCHEVGPIDGCWRDLTKPQVRQGVAVHAGSAKTAVGHRFRGFVYHFRVSLGRFCDVSRHLTRPGERVRFCEAS